MPRNDNLTAAKRTKNDEFYTQLEDIEKELVHYYDSLRNKTVFCNCNDSEQSNFWHYFDQNFDRIGLKGLVITQYDPNGPAHKLKIRRDEATGQRLPPVRTNLKLNGDFRSNESLEILKWCDVVVTNPPFSLFREYVAKLMEHEKKFIIVGSMNAITYKEIFPLLKDGKMWLGYTIPKRFRQPDGSTRVFGNVLWYTNLDIPRRHEILTLHRRYADDPGAYPKYANFDAINVDRIQDIPGDYDGLMGVPITFLNHHCPQQFDIVGISRTMGRPMSEIAEPGEYEPGGVRFYLKEDSAERKYRRLYDRIVIKRHT